jgi:hypothetical protein
MTAENTGQELNDMLATSSVEHIADRLESGDDPLDMPLSGTAASKGASEVQGAPSASPRSWGFDVNEINRSYALTIWGGKAVVVNEQPAGPVNDRVRVCRSNP